MSFESGTTALLICPMRNPMPEDFLDRFNAASAGKLDDVKADPVLGWVSGRHLLECEINEMTALYGGHLHINLRKAERKIPSQLLNAICRREELAFMQANDMLFVPRKERKRIKEDAIERNLMKMPPVISSTAAVINRDKNVLYLGTTSLKQFDNFLMEFLRVLGSECEPVPISPNEFMEKLYNKTEADLPSLNFASETGTEDEATPGRDFLTWLWYYAETELGVFKHPDLGEFTIAFEGPLSFAYSPGKAKDPQLAGSGESVVKKGNPLTSAEAKAALSVGKKLRKAKIMLARSDAEKWTFTFDADTFAFSSLALPEGEEEEINARFEERVIFLDILHTVWEGYFKKFADALAPDQLAQTEKAVRQWVRDHESL